MVESTSDGQEEACGETGENCDEFSLPETEREELAARARAEAARATASFAAAGTRKQVNRVSKSND